MSLTRITGNVIKDGTLKSEDFSPGVPLWNETGYLSATKFIGDGSFFNDISATSIFSTVINVLTSTSFTGYLSADAFAGDGSLLTNVQRALSVVEVTDNSFIIEPKHNNTVILLNSLSTIDIDISFDPFFAPGHKTIFIQNNTGRGKFISPQIYNANDFYETEKQYAVCELLNYGQFGLDWTLYGDLTSTSLTAAIPPTNSIINPNFTQIGAYRFHSAALSGTDLYVTGASNHGMLGTNDRISRSVFTKVVSAWNGTTTVLNPQFTYICPSYDNTIVLSGTDLYVTGYNSYGPLGLNDLTDKSTFTKVTIPANAKWTNVAGGAFNIFALSGTDLYGTGYAPWMGLNTSIDIGKSTFTKVTIPANAKWTAIAAGYGHTLALSGTDLYITGWNTWGQLGLNSAGLGNTLDRSTFTRITIPANAKWTAIAAGFAHTVALSGTDLYVCGYNDVGSLGLNDTNRRSTFTKVTIPANAKWTGIVAGQYSTFALSGTDIYVSGYNSYGELGLNNTTSTSTFTRITGPTSFNALSGGRFHTLALSGTTLFVTGYNAFGQLGLKDQTNRLTFTQVTEVAIPV